MKVQRSNSAPGHNGEGVGSGGSEEYVSEGTAFSLSFFSISVNNIYVVNPYH